MRDVLTELMEWWRAGETVGVGTVVATFQSAPRPPGASMLVGPDGEAVGSVSGGCVEGAVYELGRGRWSASGAPGAAAVRRLRRRRLRGRPDLRRHPRRLRREGGPRDLPRARARSPTTSRPVARSRSPPSSSTPTPPGSAAGWWSAPIRTRCPGRRPSRAIRGITPDYPGRSAASGPTTRSTTTPSACWRWAQRDAHLRSGRRAPRRGDAGLRLGLRPEAADAGLRRDRLRGRRGPGRHLPRLPRDGVRRPPGLRDQLPLPRRRRGGRRLAAPLPRGRGRGRPDRPPHRALRAHPRPQVRRTPARGGAAAAGGGLRRRDGLAAHPRGPARPAAGGRAHRARSSPGCPARSGSTWAPAPPRRPRSRIAAEIIGQPVGRQRPERWRGRPAGSTTTARADPSRRPVRALPPGRPPAVL